MPLPAVRLQPVRRPRRRGPLQLGASRRELAEDLAVVAEDLAAVAEAPAAGLEAPADGAAGTADAADAARRTTGGRKSSESSGSIGAPPW